MTPNNTPLTPNNTTIQTIVHTRPQMPVVHTPSVYMLNRISMLQTVANTMGVAVALTEDYRYDAINNVASELSTMIEGGN